MDNVAWDTVMSVLNMVVPSLATLGAAFAGVLFANIYETRRRKEEQLAIEVASGNRAIFVLSRQYNQLYILQKQWVEPFRKHDANVKHIAMPSTRILDYNLLRFEFNELGFLLESKHRGLMGELSLAEWRFQEAAWLINERSTYHQDIVQPRLENAGIKAGISYTNLLPEDILGERVNETLRGYTDDAIGLVDNTLPYLKEISDKLYEALKELHPKASIIRFEPLDNT